MRKRTTAGRRPPGEADDQDVPLEREEEMAGEHEADDDAEASIDPVVDLLFRTRLRDLDPRPAIAVGPETTVAEACRRMKEKRVGCVLVVESGRVAGIFTERDLLYKIACSDRRPSEVLIAEVMTPAPTTMKGGHRLAHALNKMSADGCRHIPIVDEAGQPTGVVSVRRIVDFLVEQFPERLLNLPHDPDQAHGRPEGG